MSSDPQPPPPSSSPTAPPVATWGAPVPRAEPAPALTAELRAGLVTAVLVSMLGAPIGLLWAAVSPKVLVERTSQGLALVSTETKSFIAADGWFFFIVLASGLVCGVVAWRLGRRYPLGTSLGLLVGCVVAALVARRVGHLVDLPRLSAVLDSLSGKPIIDPTLDVRAKGLLFVWPFSAVATYVVLLGLRPGR